MTRKDFELIAMTLKDTTEGFDADGDCRFGVEVAALNLADALATTNPRFDRERFLAACGVQS
jgi:hypothetical protein